VDSSFFKSLSKLAIVIEKYDDIKLLINVKHNLKSLILNIDTEIAYEHPMIRCPFIDIMNQLSKNYKKIKKLKFLGIKELLMFDNFVTSKIKVPYKEGFN
jgi:DNA-binding MltR family transcriptional regulator